MATPSPPHTHSPHCSSSPPTVISAPIVKVDSLLAFGLFYVVGMVLLVFVRWVANQVLLPVEAGRTVDAEISEDRNYGVAMAEAALTVAIALALSTVLPTLPCPC